MARQPTPAPSRGAALHAHIRESFDLGHAEVILLDEVRDTLDNIDALQSAIARDGVVIPTVTGEGTKSNPALIEVRLQRLALARLIATLGVPVDGELDEPLPPARPARGVYGLNLVTR